jgi:ABC-type sugar transport system ATPase subunit
MHQDDGNPGYLNADAPVLSIQHVAKGFGGVPVLQDISYDLHHGEVVALTGENGAGKSTLLHIISGAMLPDAGVFAFDGKVRHWTAPKDAIDAGIAVVHQELSVIGSLSVAENMFLGDYCSHAGLINGREMRSRARALLDEIGAGHIHVGTPMEQLRVADQQAVEIAKALRLNLKLLLLDEPTSSLTPHEVEGLFRLLKKLKARGTAIVFISHRIEEALSLCDRIVVLRDGRLVSNRAASDTDRNRIVADMAGREIAPGASRPGLSGGELLLTAEALGDGKLVREVSFTLRRGEILGLFGLVGAGRTEVLEMLYGLRPIVAGELTLNGTAFRPTSPKEAIDRGFALLPEGRKLNGILPYRPISENISLSALPRMTWAGLIDLPAERRIVADAVKKFDIMCRGVDQPIRTLSGGNQQKCILSRCLAVLPDILLLDEPTHGVDVRTKEQFYEIIRALADQGIAIIVASSEMQELFQVASRILVLSNGQTGGVRDVATATTVELMHDAFRHLH